MDIYCEANGCEKSFDGKIKSGIEHLLIQQGKKAGFTPFNYLGEYVYNIHWFCPDHAFIGKKLRKQSLEEFEKQQEEERLKKIETESQPDIVGEI